MTERGFESDEALSTARSGRTSRNLHWFIAAGLGAVVLIGFGIQSSLKARAAAAVPVAGNAEDNPVVMGREPPLNILREVLVHQVEAGSDPLRGLTPSSASLGSDPKEAEAARVQRMEVEKQLAVVAGAPMLAINRMGTAAPVNSSAPTPPSGNAPSSSARLMAEAGSALAARLPAGIVNPAGLRNPNAPGNGANQTDPALEASARAARATIPLTPIKPASARQVLEGALIPAVLLTQISSDLPGMITAQVTEDVYDSIRGHFLAIPKGSRVIGEYGSHVVGGQERIMASFHRLILPSGESFILDTPQAADVGGQAGMRDEVDDRFWKRLGGQFMTAGLARVVQAPQGGVTILGGTGNTLAGDAAGQILVDTARVGFQGNAALGPIIVIKRGYPFVILVNHDMDFSLLGHGGSGPTTR
jgi:type IV secretion system protein TrbI